MSCHGSTDDEVGGLVRLAYELLDAHEDTVRLVRPGPTDLRWDAHVDYLRRLQRVGREVLAGALAS